jgi:hypothetical protein
VRIGACRWLRLEELDDCWRVVHKLQVLVAWGARAWARASLEVLCCVIGTVAPTDEMEELSDGWGLWCRRVGIDDRDEERTIGSRTCAGTFASA